MSMDLFFDYMVAGYHRASLRKHTQLKQFVYALFTQKPKTAAYAEA